eukprot:4922392-Alexandrium_andersonii.AAC.1
MSASLVGSEMCIRDRFSAACVGVERLPRGFVGADLRLPDVRLPRALLCTCLLYTSDAADDM